MFIIFVIKPESFFSIEGYQKLMKTAMITGSSGLVGSGAVEFFSAKGWQIVGIDNDRRGYFFGKEASTRSNLRRLKKEVRHFIARDADIRDEKRIEKIFKEYSSDIQLIIHAAAQPSHDWAAREPLTDFTINANGTLNLLQQTRRHCPKAVFIFVSTNKVYGDRPNQLPLRELKTRWELPRSHPCFEGIDEQMSIDGCLHSLFGVSKASADLLVQEYGRYFGLKTGCFRAGCLTGPRHAGAELHGFLSYLMKCCLTGDPYTIYGYKGKQVRDNLHSFDLVNAFDHFYQHPRSGEVYNIGGGRLSHCSLLEAIELCEKISGRKLKWIYSRQARRGDHIWYISRISKFQDHYPDWKPVYDLQEILNQIFLFNKDFWIRGRIPDKKARGVYAR